MSNNNIKYPDNYINDQKRQDLLNDYANTIFTLTGLIFAVSAFIIISNKCQKNIFFHFHFNMSIMLVLIITYCSTTITKYGEGPVSYVVFKILFLIALLLSLFFNWIFTSKVLSNNDACNNFLFLNNGTII